MTKEEFAELLKGVVTKCTPPNHRSFAFNERDEESLTYEAVYPGNQLPILDLKGLGAHLAAKPTVASHLYSKTEPNGMHCTTNFNTGASFRGYLDGVQVNLFLRCAGSGVIDGAEQLH